MTFALSALDTAHPAHPAQTLYDSDNTSYVSSTTHSFFHFRQNFIIFNGLHERIAHAFRHLGNQFSFASICLLTQLTPSLHCRCVCMCLYRCLWVCDFMYWEDIKNSCFLADQKPQHCDCWNGSGHLFTSKANVICVGRRMGAAQPERLQRQLALTSDPSVTGYCRWLAEQYNGDLLKAYAFIYISIEDFHI